MLQLILDKLSLHLQKRSNNNEETWEGKIKLKDRFECIVYTFDNRK